MKVQNSLRSQILIALIVTGIIPLALAGAILIILDQQTITTQSARELTGLVRGFSSEVDLYMSSRMNDTKLIASLPEIVSNVPAQQEVILKQTYLLFSDFSQLAIFTLEGVQQATALPNSTLAVDRFASFQNAAQRGEQGWEITESTLDKTRSVIIFTPIRNSERNVVAVLGGVVNWPTLTSVIERLSIGTGGRAFILNEQAQTVFQPDPGFVASIRQSTWPELKSGLPPAGPGTFRISSEDGPHIFAFAPIQNLGWTAIVERPETELLAPVQRARAIGIIGLTVSIALALAAAVVATNWLARPLQQLATAATAFGAGDSNAPLPRLQSSTNEINTLVHAFAEMRSAVSAALRSERSERALNEAILSSVPIGLGVLSSDLRVKAANQTLSELIGTANHGIVGKSLSQLWASDNSLEYGAQVALKGTTPVHHLALERKDPRQLLRVFFDRIKTEEAESEPQLLIGIEDLTEFSQVKLRYQSMEMLQSISQIILSSSKLEETLQRTLEIASSLRGFDIGIVWLISANEQELNPTVLYGLDSLTPLQVEAAESHQIVGIRTLQTLTGESEIAAARFYLRDRGMQQLITIPLRTDSHIFGAVELASRNTFEFDSVEMELLAAIGNQISHAVQKFRLDEALRKSEAEARILSLVASRTTNAVIIANRRGEIEWVNEGFTHVTGYGIDEVIGRTPGSILQGPASDTVVVDFMRAKLRAGEGFHTEVVNYRKGGEAYWIEIEVQPIFDPNGNVIRFMALESDITERKRTHEELQYQKALLEAQSEAALDGILVVSPERKWLAVNRRFREIWGVQNVTPQPTNSRDGLALMLSLVSDKEQFIERIESLYDNPLEPGLDEIHMVDGRILERYAAPVVGEDGMLFGRVWFYRDITERKRFMEELQEQREFAEQIMNNMGQGLIVTDENLQFSYVNPAFSRLLKQPNDELIGKTQFDITAKEFWPTLREAQRSWRTGNTTTYEVSLLVDGKEQLPVLITASSRWSEGKQVGAISVVTDIAERKQAEEYLRTAKETAEQASRAKSEFLSRMSHELRTPLNAILGFAQVLQMDTLTANQQNNTAQILNAGQHLLELINEVLDIARIEAGRLSISPEPVQIWNVVQEGIDMVRPMAVARNIHFRQLSAQDNLHLKVDRQRLKQVLVNLLSNAIKYNRYGGTVSVNWEQRAANRVRIKVSDTGYGISAEKQERLFIPFDRLDSEAGDIEGTGLGLALSKRLVEVMGGEIGIESIPDQGSTFWIDLPSTESPVPVTTPANANANREVPATEHIRNILCIEDNPSNLQLIENIFQRQPNTIVLTALQGRLGITLAREYRPDIVLLDLHLPDIHGSEVVTELQNDEATRNIPIIILSADATSSQIERLKQQGIFEYITKPLNIRQFLDTVNRALDSRKK